MPVKFSKQGGLHGWTAGKQGHMAGDEDAIFHVTDLSDV